mmetsp:Transcript_11688/g.47209  ORF Transcript_11688/g.47209 Transcript_11688/m.47209 type:complete len:120 (+) Transcript_11688:105-464(+)
MAAGPFIRIIIQLAIPFVRAFGAAYQQALSNARRDGANAARESLKKAKGMTTTEATQILNLTESEATNLKTVEESYRRIFEANDPKNGGSFYLQSKVYRAHQVLVLQHREQQQEQEQQK